MISVDTPQLPAGASSPTLDVARATVRDALLNTEAFRELDHERQRALALGLVHVADRTAALMLEQAAAEAAYESQGSAPPLAEPLASAGDELGVQATRELASTTHDVLRAVSFPRFVEELINGVFKSHGR